VASSSGSGRRTGATPSGSNARKKKSTRNTNTHTANDNERIISLFSVRQPDKEIQKSV